MAPVVRALGRRPLATSLGVGAIVFGVVYGVGVAAERFGGEPASRACTGLGFWDDAEALRVAADEPSPEGPGAGADDTVEVAGDARAPRAILSRVWFDRYPEKSRDKIRIWIWLAGGIGITEHGSFFDARFELFEFERQNDKLSMVFFQDRKKSETKFKVEACDDTPPFDLCLTLDESPRGPTKLFGFGDDEDLALHIPWGPAAQRIAKERAASLKR